MLVCVYEALAVAWGIGPSAHCPPPVDRILGGGEAHCCEMAAPVTMAMRSCTRCALPGGKEPRAPKVRGSVKMRGITQPTKPAADKIEGQDARPGKKSTIGNPFDGMLVDENGETLRGEWWIEDRKKGRGVNAAKTGEVERVRTLNPNQEEYVDYRSMYGVITSWKPFQSVEIDEARTKVGKRGVVVVDVREAASFAQGHLRGAVNVPLFVPQYTGGAYGALRKLALAGLGMKAKERNPGFRDELRAACKGAKEVVLLCYTGGTVQPKYDGGVNMAKKYGEPSRSLMAAYELKEAGIKVNKVSHVLRGWAWWVYEHPEDETLP